MRVVIAGGSGFLGRPLAASLAADGHDVFILTRAPANARSDLRSSAPTPVTWTPDGGTGAWRSIIDGADAVVNLAGESIAAKRWSAAQKQKILDTRVAATRSLVAAIRAAASPPAVFVSGSAVGYYGARGGEIVTEESPAGSDFLARVCVTWEEEAQRAASPSVRVVCVRTGLVLEKDGGALPPMLPPFRFGAGGPVGSGRQFWPWIHRRDWVDLVRWTMTTIGVSGGVNATAPNPATNADFARAVGRALHRPALIPAPAFALRLMLGEMADALVLSGQRAVPEKAVANGFRFAFEDLDAALQTIFAG